MLEESFLRVYTKFKLYFYKQMFSRFQDREASLTTVETFSAEIIYDLGNPTVGEFADFTRISAPNAAYKVNGLIKKGYVVKERSETDHREYHLRVTDRFLNYYSINSGYVDKVMGRLSQSVSTEDLATFERVLNVIADELTPEIDLPPRSDES